MDAGKVLEGLLEARKKKALFIFDEWNKALQHDGNPVWTNEDFASLRTIVEDAVEIGLLGQTMESILEEAANPK